LVNETVEATNVPPKHCGVRPHANSFGPGRPASICSSERFVGTVIDVTQLERAFRAKEESTKSRERDVTEFAR
jgi:hypothetical protein